MVDDDNFIDDSGVDPADRYGSDHEPNSPGNAPQVGFVRIKVKVNIKRLQPLECTKSYLRSLLVCCKTLKCRVPFYFISVLLFWQAEEGEDDDEIKGLFKMGKKKKKSEKSAAEIALLVENVMAELEVVAEDDAVLNRQSKPAINKLKKLPLLTEVLSK